MKGQERKGGVGALPTGSCSLGDTGPLPEARREQRTDVLSSSLPDRCGGSTASREPEPMGTWVCSHWGQPHEPRVGRAKKENGRGAGQVGSTVKMTGKIWPGPGAEVHAGVRDTAGCPPLWGAHLGDLRGSQ